MAETPPKNRLDRIGRDLSRTLLHGSRPKQPNLPLTITTGQQVRADLPATGDMLFKFNVPQNGGNPATISVRVPHDQADARQDEMKKALYDQNGRAKYLKLDIAENIPTWVFSQRSHSLPKTPPAEETIAITAPRDLTIFKLPTSALNEVAQGDDCNISLCRYNSTTNSMEDVARALWQPAILLHFKLSRIELRVPLAGEQIFEIKGISQSERYFLDQLGLLGSLLPDFNDKKRLPTINSVSFALRASPQGSPTLVRDWSIVRTNLTREARSGQQSLRAAGPAEPLNLPYVAVAHDDPDPNNPDKKNEDALKLLQMGSITNSGGYFLRVATTLADVDTLTLVVVLQSVSDTNTDNAESAWMPGAANSLALAAGTSADSIRFNGLDHITISPAVPPGQVSFAWTRTQPSTITDPVDKFGYGTISLVEYSAKDAAGKSIGYSAEQCVAISPSKSIRGDSYTRYRPLNLDKSNDLYESHTGSTAALRLLGPHQPRARSLALEKQRDDLSTVHFHATLQCYEDESKSYERFGDPIRSRISISPGFFRDVFGNRFEYHGPEIRRRLFYTDKLIGPGDWPGIRFALSPVTHQGEPQLLLECCYRFVEPPEQDQKPPLPPSPQSYADYNTRKETRLNTLAAILKQLAGVNGDVVLSVAAKPLIADPTPVDLTQLIKFIKSCMSQQEMIGPNDTPMPVQGPNSYLPSRGTIADISRFAPELLLRRTKEAYGPSDSDLPDEKILRNQIKSQVMSARSLVSLQPAPSQPLNLEELKKWDYTRAHVAYDQTNSEFLSVAKAFNEVFSIRCLAQVGFLRNRLNEHELWFVPDEFFPTAPATDAEQRDWFFATARPLRNTLGNETFQIPKFSERCTQEPCWEGHPIVQESVIDQDFDELGRTAFRLIEKVSSDHLLVTTASSAVETRNLLRERERIGLTLSTFGKDASAYLVPLHKTGDDLDGPAVTRAARDAFLSNLDGYYAIDTVLQLPLARAGAKQIRAFEGRVTATHPGQPEPRTVPAFSDILLAGGQRRLTILYDLPPGVRDASEAARTTVVSTTFTHIQLRPDAEDDDIQNPFSLGQWIELISPKQLAWKAPDDVIPVATRSFPSKPIMRTTDALMPWVDPLSGEFRIPGPITSANAQLLARWGWKFKFDLIDGGPRDNDKVHVTINYNQEVSPTASIERSAPSGDWKPSSLLNCLSAIKQLSDSGLLKDESLSGRERLRIAGELSAFLAADLEAPNAALRSISGAIYDRFEIEIPPNITGQVTAPDEDEDQPGRKIMKGKLDKLHPNQSAITVTWDGSKDHATAIVVARPDVLGNEAFLAGSNEVRNYTVTLNRRRNERFGPGKKTEANPCLVYNGQIVTSPVECWAQNIWPMRLVYDAKGASLRSALTAFLGALLKDAAPSSFSLEVAASLVWGVGKFEVVTPFSVLPNDMPAGNATAIATLIADKLGKLIQTSKPDMNVAAALRLGIKIAAHIPARDFAGRILMEVKSIDFSL